MPSKVLIYSDSTKLTQPNTNKCSGVTSSGKAVIVLFILATFLLDLVDGVWSVKAMDRLRAQKAASSTSTAAVDEEFEYKVAVFYGNRLERLQNRHCEKLKCEFVSMGCVITQRDPPPSFTCHTIWSEMSQPPAGDCPYKPCEGYNQKSVCVSNERSCLMHQGELVHFGLCREHKRCCQFPKIP